MKKSLKLLALAISSTLVLSLCSCSLKNENKLKIKPSDFDSNNSVYTIKTNIGSAPTLCVYDYSNDKMLEVTDLDSNYEQAVIYDKDLLTVQDSKTEKDFMFKINSNIQFEMVDYASITNDILDQEDNYILSYNYEDNNFILKEMTENKVENKFSVEITKDEDSVSGAINIDKNQVYLCYTDNNNTILETYDFSGELINKETITDSISRFKLKYINNKLFLLETSVYEKAKDEYVPGTKVYEYNNGAISPVIECTSAPNDISYISKTNEYIVVDTVCANFYDNTYSELSKVDLNNSLYGSYLRSIILDDRVVLLFDQGVAISVNLERKDVKEIGLNNQKE